MTNSSTLTAMAGQLDLAEVRLHLESLNAAAAELAPSIRRAQHSLLAHLQSQEVDLEELWLAIEPELGLTAQQHETVRLLREELSEQARPVSFAAAGGLILFTSLGGGDSVDVDLSDGGESFDSGVVAVQSLDSGGSEFGVVSPAVDLAPELASVVAGHPGLADALGELLNPESSGETFGDPALSGGEWSPGGETGPSSGFAPGGDATPPGAVLAGLGGPGGSAEPSGEPVAAGSDTVPATEGDAAPEATVAAPAADATVPAAGATAPAAGATAPAVNGGGQGNGGPNSEHASAVAGTTPGEDVAPVAQDSEIAGTTPGEGISDLAGGGGAEPAADPAPAPAAPAAPGPPAGGGGNGGGNGGGKGGGNP